MNEEKRFGGSPQGFGAGGKEASGDDKSRTHPASRARNRTVMLTPEMTGQVRALLYQEGSETPPADDSRRDPINELLPPMDWSRPERAGAADASEGPYSRETEDFGSDLGSGAEHETDRGGSTGKIDAIPVRQALASSLPPEPRRMAPPPQAHQPPPMTPNVNVTGGAIPSGPAAGGPGFSVNAGANPRATAPIGSRRFGMENQNRPRVAPTSRVVGFLVSFDREKNGEVHEIRAGRWLVTSRPTDQGEYLLIEDRSVSPLHAIVRATKDGKIEVLDQLSEFGTSVLKCGSGEEIDAAGVRVSVAHGDVVRFGERAFVVCTVPQVGAVDEEESES